jgi:hypothetical protein
MHFITCFLHLICCVFAAIIASLLQYTCLIVLDVIEVLKVSLHDLSIICIQTNLFMINES